MSYEAPNTIDWQQVAHLVERQINQIDMERDEAGLLPIPLAVQLDSLLRTQPVLQQMASNEQTPTSEKKDEATICLPESKAREICEALEVLEEREDQLQFERRGFVGENHEDYSLWARRLYSDLTFYITGEP